MRRYVREDTQDLSPRQGAALRLCGSSPHEGVQPRTTRFDDVLAVQGLQTLWMLSADTPRFDP